MTMLILIIAAMVGIFELFIAMILGQIYLDNKREFTFTKWWTRYQKKHDKFFDEYKS